MKDRRELMLSLASRDLKPAAIPAAFFLHFAPEFHRGPAAVARHLEYFRFTGMDFVKIQFEHKFPSMPELSGPGDWARVKLLEESYFADPLDVVDGLVKEAGKEALVLVTLYSPFMCAGHLAGRDTLVRHLEKEPEAVKKGLEIVTRSLLAFVRGCISRGVDGFYASTQGAEAGLFSRPDIFTSYIRPFDLAVWELIRDACRFNILHVCDYHGVYDSFDAVTEYPGQIVNAGLRLSDRTLTGREVSEIFGRPFMGGMDRHGVIATGPREAIRRAAEAAIREAPERFVLGADCTVPPETSWENLREAIEAAHAHRRA